MKRFTDTGKNSRKPIRVWRSLIVVPVSIMLILIISIPSLSVQFAKRLDSVESIFNYEMQEYEMKIAMLEARMESLGLLIEQLMKEEYSSSTLQSVLEGGSPAYFVPSAISFIGMSGLGEPVSIHVTYLGKTGGHTTVEEASGPVAVPSPRLFRSAAAGSDDADKLPFWGLARASQSSSHISVRPVPALYRRIDSEGVTGYLLLTLDMRRIGEWLSAGIPVESSGWIISDDSGKLLGVHFEGTENDPGLAYREAARLLSEIESGLDMTGFHRGRTSLFGDDVRIFSNNFSDGWQFVSVIPAAELFDDQNSLLRIYAVLVFFLFMMFHAVRLTESQQFADELLVAGEKIERMIIDEADDMEANTSLDTRIASLLITANESIANLKTRLLETRSRNLQNQKTAIEAAKFYAHVRSLNLHGIYIDLFEYSLEDGMITFSSGLSILTGSGSVILCEMYDAEFFERFKCLIAGDIGEKKTEISPDSLKSSLGMFRQAARACISKRQPFSIEFRAMKSDYKLVWIRCLGVPDDGLKNITGAIMDITNEVKLRKIDRKRLITEQASAVTVRQRTHYERNQ